MRDYLNQVISVVIFNLPTEIIFPITPCKLLQDMIHLYLQNKYKQLEVDSLVHRQNTQTRLASESLKCLP